MLNYTANAQNGTTTATTTTTTTTPQSTFSIFYLVLGKSFLVKVSVSGTGLEFFAVLQDCKK